MYYHSIIFKTFLMHEQWRIRGRFGRGLPWPSRVGHRRRVWSFGFIYSKEIAERQEGAKPADNSETHRAPASISPASSLYPLFCRLGGRSDRSPQALLSASLCPAGCFHSTSRSSNSSWSFIAWFSTSSVFLFTSPAYCGCSISTERVPTRFRFPIDTTRARPSRRFTKSLPTQDFPDRPDSQEQCCNSKEESCHQSRRSRRRHCWHT